MIRQTKDPGFGEKYQSRNKRIINKDGSFNIERRGRDASGRDMYQHLINKPWPAFLLYLLLIYIIVNTLFALVYLVIGVDQIAGVGHDSMLSDFAYAFFFSAQTLTSVGYGALHPSGVAANTLAAFEAFVGLAGFALMTGLLYGRFSRPNSKILYSRNAIIAPYNDKTSLQFRIVNQRSNVLMEMVASTLFSHIDENGLRKYYQLQLETSNIYFFPLNWTLVHVIDEDSPLFGLDHATMMEQDAEILILIKGFDDTFGQVVHSRFSYKAEEVVVGARFTKAYGSDDDGNIIMDVNAIHAYEEVELPNVNVETRQLISS